MQHHHRTEIDVDADEQGVIRALEGVRVAVVQAQRSAAAATDQPAQVQQKALTCSHTFVGGSDA